VTTRRGTFPRYEDPEGLDQQGEGMGSIAEERHFT